MEKVVYITSENEMINLGYKIGEKLDKNSVITLSGDLGAGKTTLTKGIGQALNINSVINSPTFTILKIHQGRLPFYHMDVYRISESSGDDSLEEYFELDGVCVVEWAENIKYLLPLDYINIKIEIISEKERKVTITSYGEKYHKILEELNVWVKKS